MRTHSDSGYRCKSFLSQGSLGRICKPRAFADEKSEYSTFIDSVEAEQLRWRSGSAVPVRVITPEELAALDPGLLRTHILR